LEITPESLVAALGEKADTLLSDMAPNTTGNRFTDHCRQLELARRALMLCKDCLKEGGSFVVKVFDGEDGPVFVREVEAQFRTVKRIKPDATRDRSVEFFLVGIGFIGDKP
jgi:23S rRNA (uridine2552-2'-O)-methyltransferase